MDFNMIEVWYAARQAWELGYTREAAAYTALCQGWICSTAVPLRAEGGALALQAFDCYIAVLRHLRAQRHLLLAEEVTEVRNGRLEGLDQLAVETGDLLACAASSVRQLNRQRCHDLQWAVEQLADIGRPVFDTFEELLLQLLRNMPVWWLRNRWRVRGTLNAVRASRGWSDERDGARPFYDQLTRRAETRQRQNRLQIIHGSLVAPSSARRNAPGEGAFTLLRGKSGLQTVNS